MPGSGAVIAKMWAWATEKKIALEALSKVTSVNAVNYAKTNKKWKDITGNARASLHGDFYWESPTILKVYVAHGMEYGVWLELAMDRHYAILEEAINKNSQSFFEGIKRIMEH
jgi:hypothetical protein